MANSNPIRCWFNQAQSLIKQIAASIIAINIMTLFFIPTQHTEPLVESEFP